MDNDDVVESDLEPVVEFRGRCWLVYWIFSADGARCVMYDGCTHVEARNPHELQNLYADACLLLQDDELAVDVACDRLKVLLKQRGEWRGIR